MTSFLKRAGLFVITTIFFLLVNTRYFWERNIGVLAMLTFLLLIVYFVVLTMFLLEQVYYSSKENFEDKQRLSLIGFIALVLTLTFLYPSGLINFAQLESRSVLIAQREGAANCMTTLRIKEDSTFVEKITCFGVKETRGEYMLSGDTIYFETILAGSHEEVFYEFAVVNEDETGKHLGTLIKYRDSSDTVGHALEILKNELKNSP